MAEKGKWSARKKGVLIAVAVLCMFLLVGGGIYVGMHMNQGDPQEPQNALELDDAAQDWAGTVPPDKNGSQQGIKIPGYESISLPAGQEDVKIAFLNPEGNPCYFTFELVLDDTGETLYASKMVAPGKAIQEETLSRSLDAGEYGATIKVSTYSLEDQTQMNGANVKTKLLVG